MAASESLSKQNSVDKGSVLNDKEKTSSKETPTINGCSSSPLGNENDSEHDNQNSQSSNKVADKEKLNINNKPFLDKSKERKVNCKTSLDKSSNKEKNKDGSKISLVKSSKPTINRNSFVESSKEASVDKSRKETASKTLDKSSKETDNKTSLEKSSKETANKTSLEKSSKETANKTSLEKSSKETANKTSLEKSSKETTNKTSLEKSNKETVLKTSLDIPSNKETTSKTSLGKPSSKETTTKTLGKTSSKETTSKTTLDESNKETPSKISLGKSSSKETTSETSLGKSSSLETSKAIEKSSSKETANKTALVKSASKEKIESKPENSINKSGNEGSEISSNKSTGKGKNKNILKNSEKLTGKKNISESENSLDKDSDKNLKSKCLEKLSKSDSEETSNSKAIDTKIDSKDGSTLKSSEENSGTSSKSSENEEKITRDNSPSNDSKDKPLENGEVSSKETSRPDTPMSHTSSDLDLEESLLKEDTNLPNDDHDDFCEEKLLQETDDILLTDKSIANSSKSTSVADVPDGKLEKSSDSDRQEKEIEKILKSFNSSIGKKDNSSSSDKLNKSTVECNANSNTSSTAMSNTKLSDELSTEVQSNSSLPGNSSSKTSGKRSCPDDKKSNSDSSNKLLKLDVKKVKEASNIVSKTSEKAKTALEPKGKKMESSTKPTSKKNAITFSEALKSIALESKQSPFVSMDTPQPLIPVTEVSLNEISPTSANLTVLGAMETRTQTVESNQIRSTSPGSLIIDMEPEGQGKKRTLTESYDSTTSSLKPNLKKIRVFRKEDGNNKNEGVNDDIAKAMELNKTMTSRLEEEKAIHDSQKPATEVAPLNNGLICLDSEEDLQMKTVQEMRKANLNDKKLKRIKRKDLESLVIELFVDKVLYEHQLGQQKDLCKRLEATLESNRKKAAQFHKEIEDLKKVTQRLQAEHQSRKGQVIAPVKVKRSVGIQATPTIIGKGIMHASTNGNIRVLSPTCNSSTMSSNSSMNSISRSSSSSSRSMSLSGNQVRIANSSSSASAISSSSSSTSSSITTANTKTSQTSSSIALKTVQIPSNDFKLVNSVTPVPRQMANVNNNMKVLQPGSVVASQPIAFTNSQAGSGAQVVVVNPLVMQQTQNVGVGSQILPVGPTRVIRTPLTSIPSTNLTAQSTQFATSTVVQGTNNSSSNSSSSSTFIDLTDDEEASRTRTTLQPGSLVAIQRTSGVNITQSTSGQFVTLNPPTSVGQLVLVPSTPGQATTALVVGSVANSTQSLSSSVVRSAGVSQNTNVRFSSSIVNTTRVVVGAPLNGTTSFVAVPRHPAPLPRAPPQQTSGYSKKLPPVPVLKLSHKDNSIVLSWNMAKTDEHERVASYQLYAYQEGTTPPTPALWKKVGSVKALELPMACTLTQFMPGHVYHFAVRAVDIRSRLGPFSDPRTIRLGK